MTEDDETRAMDDLEERLRKVESSKRRSGADDVTTCWHRNPDGPEAADRLRTYREALERIRDGNHTPYEFGYIASQALKG